MNALQPGNLIRARGRDWVIQNESRPDWLILRPLGGSDDDIVALIPDLELEPVQSATFAPPNPQYAGNHNGAILLRDALRLKLRAGAGPFRSFGNIAVEPRAYQLVPLLMALRLPTVRLLIADDVGIGKTIEAGLIVRELMDRGEISHFAVLCPPHLADQWQNELATHFNLNAIVLTAATAARIDRELPHGARLFDHYPIIIVSLDYIKSDSHREFFLTQAPECVIVDEAHTCASGQKKQQRFELLSRLAVDETRHILLLTATPHSGDETAYSKLLSLLRPEFLDYAANNEAARKRLARHFVQRRRIDIAEWQEKIHDRFSFPRRKISEVTYQLTGTWGNFFDDVQAYCRDLAERIKGREQLIWYTTIGLLRCVASSPEAAQIALENRLSKEAQDLIDAGESEVDDQVYDGDEEDFSGSDIEPALQVEDRERLRELIAQAQRLAGQQGDPKLKALIEHLKQQAKDGFNTVVFCRYIGTANYVARHLKEAFPDHIIEAVTGELPPDDRRQRVESMVDNERRILVATDCLSEGINLQHLFNAVVHYDLAWNPTRHEQREGRVDRFGQRSEEVRCTMLYGNDNPVDGLILKVIIKKSNTIREALGVLVPIPEDEASIQKALLKAALIKRSDLTRGGSNQLALFEEDVQPIETRWQDALDKIKKRHTIFAQLTIKPEEVLPEWQKQQEALGNHEDVRRFLTSACARLNAPLEPKPNNQFRLIVGNLPEVLRLRLLDEGVVDDKFKPLTLDIANLHRSDPLIAVLAEHLLEDSLENAKPLAARCAVTETDAVHSITTLYLLRLRHQLSYQRQREDYQMMAEEAVILTVTGRTNPQWEINNPKLLDCQPTGNLSPAIVQKEIGNALAFLEAHHQELDRIAKERGEALKEQHQRVRAAAREDADKFKYSVKALLPVDIIGVYVLLPEAL